MDVTIEASGPVVDLEVHARPIPAGCPVYEPLGFFEQPFEEIRHLISDRTLHRRGDRLRRSTGRLWDHFLMRTQNLNAFRP